MAKNNLDQHLRRRYCIKSQAESYSKYLTSMEKDNISEEHFLELETKFKLIKSLFDEFKSVQTNIEDKSKQECLDAELSERFKIQDQFTNIIAKSQIVINNYKQNNSPKEAATRASPGLHIKLPEIQLANFHGDCDKWLSFRDNFVSLIHSNNNLSKVQKFHYLSASLRGKALETIRSMQITEANYDIAWGLLHERYENKRLILNTHFKELFELPQVGQREPQAALRILVDSLNKNLRVLKSLGQPVEHWDSIIIYLVNTKLDSQTKLEWEKLNPSNVLPTLDSLLSFLSERCTMLETLNPAKSSVITKGHVKAFPVTGVYCPLDKQEHKLFQCKQFLSSTVASRMKLIKKHNLCSNCLRPGHAVEACLSQSRCKKCGHPHNTLIHTDLVEVRKERVNDESNLIATHTSNTCNFKQVLLSTALITIFDSNGKPHLVRALLDSGSQSNFMTRELCKKLSLPEFKVNIPIHGVAESSTTVKGGVEATIKSRINNYKVASTFLILPSITDRIPATTLHKSQIKLPTKLPLADPRFYVSNRVDLLLGASVFWDLLCVGQIRSHASQPKLQKTKFGWVAVGDLGLNRGEPQRLSCHVTSSKYLSDQLQKFWTIEEVSEEPELSKESLLCKAHFERHTIKDSNGRFVVRLPFKQSPSALGDSFSMALRRFLMLEKRLTKNPAMKEEYTCFMREYESLQHMSQVSPPNDISNNQYYYLPHHCVIKNSQTTKLRVVFDASAKTTSGLSLNEILMVGPTLQQQLFDIILRFRKHPIVITADVEKMYRQILVHKQDQDYQRILWRENPTDPIKHFALNTVTYGTASASYLAIQCLQKTGLQHQESFPAEAKIILNDFYVDDLLTGANTPEEAMSLIRNLQKILAFGQFNLRKWASNNKEVLNQTLNVSESIDHVLVEADLSKTLGLLWNSKTDSLHYNTKRFILSEISKLFDPLGLLGPIIIRAKFILQRLFQLNLAWDESIPMDLHSAWTKFYSELVEVNDIMIPRQVVSHNPIRLELHGFCDASERAYGACVYIRSTFSGNEHTTKLLCAKSKVAPLKVISLPRLELSGALLLSRLIKRISQAMDLHYTNIYYWCDSTITLAWIQKDPNNWKTFVANRVSEIQRLTNSDNWFHVATQYNPADLISRGLSVESLSNSELWWNGPEWLQRNRKFWPSSRIKIHDSEVPEAKPSTLVSFYVANKGDLFERYSALPRLQRVVAYCFRFSNNARAGNLRLTGSLSVSELDKSLSALIKIAQGEEFHSEINSLKNSQPLKHSSKLLTLNPFLDDQFMMRVGGRLDKSQLEYQKKHQILLPKGHKLTQLIVMHEHKKNLHLGPRALLSNIRLQYWIPHGINVIKGVLSKCITCFRVKPTLHKYQMGELPEARVTPSRPFTNCGVDFAGPFNIRSSRLRNSKILKAYLCVFVCFATKATHLEVVSDLTTDGFLNCLKRFISRRGKCNNIYTDNGTNFVGARNELIRVRDFLRQTHDDQTITNYLQQDNINWHFIPPRSPHFGGLWESAVKSAKQHLKRVVGDQTLTFEELTTLFTQIEACLNSRPLTPLSDNPNDFSALTPGHFLIGDSLLSLPDHNLRALNSNHLSRYQLLVQMLQHFWDRWSKEYLNTLQVRYKWRVQRFNIKPNSLVLIKEENVPPLRWTLGRITEVHPGKDGVVRVVSIKTSSGTSKRSVNNICILPV